MSESAPARLKALMAEIRRQRRERGVPPTIRELAAGLSRSTAGVHNDLRVLRSEGRVDWQDNRPRTLRIVRKPR